jgi:hypothetical protein
MARRQMLLSRGLIDALAIHACSTVSACIQYRELWFAGVPRRLHCAYAQSQDLFSGNIVELKILWQINRIFNKQIETL